MSWGLKGMVPKSIPASEDDYCINLRKITCLRLTSWALFSDRDKTHILLISKRLGLFSEGEDCTELGGLARICGCSWRSSRQRIVYGLKGDTRYRILFVIYSKM